MTTTTSTSRPSCAADPTPPAPPASGAALTHQRPARPWPTRVRRGLGPTERPARPWPHRASVPCTTLVAAHGRSVLYGPVSAVVSAESMVAGRALGTPHAAACVPRVRVRAAHVFAPRADVRAPRAHSSAISCARSWNVRMVVVRARGCGSCVVSRVLMASVARWCSRPAQMFAPRAHIRRQFRARGRGTCAGWWNVRVVVVRARWMVERTRGRGSCALAACPGGWCVARTCSCDARVFVGLFVRGWRFVRVVSRVLVAGAARWCLRAAQVFARRARICVPRMHSSAISCAR